MYVTNAYRMDHEEALELASSIGVGQFVTNSDEGMEATLLPFVLKLDDDRVVVETHFARVNRQWEDEEVLIIVQGPTTFISGLDLPPEPEDARLPRVPSMDYVTVHMKGRMRHRQHDEEFTLRHLAELVDKFEDEWNVPEHSDPRLVKDILPALVAVEIEVTEVLGKWKLHQGLTPDEIQYTADNLRRRGTEEAAQVASLMESKAIPWAEQRAARNAVTAQLPVPKPSKPRPPHVYKYERG
ncbi:FMN-binding negative transcriptional regulator [Corynebacterium breve]|uniref:FMN-binding negative transcriptional regulator n=1 Tax=Corynebacterium breve TaxID=3049799 RepID=A0ABY8VBT6_9CORY|nr:FMN-binding negative transcriptional regulator [Corynebacterium breve]WIM67136.1 FMN-binding negative transcriptional regulator [Corynebacterium breve]